MIPVLVYVTNKTVMVTTNGMTTPVPVNVMTPKNVETINTGITINATVYVTNKTVKTTTIGMITPVVVNVNNKTVDLNSGSTMTNVNVNGKIIKFKNFIHI